jgi:hypothetical protein
MDATYNLSGGFKPTIKRFADLDGPDFFRTPAWATYALIDNEKFSGEIWESACGDGAMSRVKTGCSISSSDLHDRGYGDVGIDFLTAKRQAENIVTNPPYNSASICPDAFWASGSWLKQPVVRTACADRAKKALIDRPSRELPAHLPPFSQREGNCDRPCSDSCRLPGSLGSSQDHDAMQSE